MTQQAKDNAGFTLPAPVEGTQADPAPATPQTGAAPATVESLPVASSADVDTSSRDALIGGGVLLVLFIAFFFAKNAYANMLVAKRLQPGKANASGWWLFIFLASLSTGVVLAAVNAPKFMAPLIIGPLTLIGLIALVLMLLSARK